jgi:hypothetical protein
MKVIQTIHKIIIHVHSPTYNYHVSQRKEHEPIANISRSRDQHNLHSYYDNLKSMLALSVLECCTSTIWCACAEGLLRSAHCILNRESGNRLARHLSVSVLSYSNEVNMKYTLQTKDVAIRLDPRSLCLYNLWLR